MPSLEQALANQFLPSELSDLQWSSLVEEGEEAPKLDTVRQMVITAAPETLVVMLERNNPYTGDKMSDKVPFDTTLDLTKFLSPEAHEKGMCAKYVLSGIVVQAGTAGFGQC